MNKYTSFLTALIGGSSCTEQEIAQGLAALNATGVELTQVKTQADGSFKCGRNKECFRGVTSMRSSGYILTPSYTIDGDGDSKDAGEMNPFSIGRMDDKTGGVRIQRGRYHVEIKDAFFALAGVFIDDNEIYKEDLIPQIIERINSPKIKEVFEEVVNSEMTAEELKAARKAAKQAEKAAKIAAKKCR